MQDAREAHFAAAAFAPGRQAQKVSQGFRLNQSMEERGREGTAEPLIAERGRCALRCLARLVDGTNSC